MPDPFAQTDITRRPKTLHGSTTAAITTAALSELAKVGLGRLSMEVIAKQAGVGKAALYRRWSSKDEMIVSLLSEIGSGYDAPADTGNLVGDLTELLRIAAAILTAPIYSKIIPHLYAEMATDTALADLLRSALHPNKQRRADELIDRAVLRGELASNIDRDIAVDFVYGPMYWRIVVLGNGLSSKYVELLAKSTAAALKELSVICSSKRADEKPPTTSHVPKA